MLAGALLAILCAPAGAEITRTEVISREAVPGKVAAERIRGVLHFALNPEENTDIEDLALAEKAPDGMVKFTADFELLIPKAAEHRNGWWILEPPNRGKKNLPGWFDRTGTEPDFLLAAGYSIAWVGWQSDLLPGSGRLRVQAPRLLKAVSGRLRVDYFVQKPSREFSLADPGHRAYLPSSVQDAVLTVRNLPDASGVLVPREQWRFQEGRVELTSGNFEPGRIYEVSYQAEEQEVPAAGFAALRDFAAMLKHGGPDFPGPALGRVLGFGVSQSAMALRGFLNDVGNADGKGRPLFDAMLLHVAGGRKTVLGRFSQPGRTAGPSRNAKSHTLQAPFADVEASGRPLVLVKAAQQKAIPKLFHTFSSYEYWGCGASLLHTDGKKDLGDDGSSRYFLLAGGQHGPAGFPPRHTPATAHPPNPNEYRWAVRALLPALTKWVEEGVAPPASQVPRWSDGSMVAWDKLQFPALPGVRQSGHPAIPKNTSPAQLGVPAVDSDGNERAGIRLPEIAEPLATYTGWNPRPENPAWLENSTGAYLAFPWTAEDRKESGDPRRSVLERYRTRQDYLARVRDYAISLARSGYLLEQDIPAIVDQASRHWDYRMPPLQSQAGIR